uniref:Uncharacterized protein n=1 Tax=Anguilla anguilla TaxID=7936 RepID=A0A0E9SNZ3_ANGAN
MLYGCSRPRFFLETLKSGVT